MKSIRLKAKDFKKQLIENGYDLEISKKDAVEKREDKEEGLIIYLLNGLVAFFEFESKLIPSLKYLQSHSGLLKKVVVDMGAVKFVAGGADIMRPGIREVDPSIIVEDIVVIVDEKNNVPLCVGKALFCATDLMAQQSGKSIKNIHYINDKIWKL